MKKAGPIISGFGGLVTALTSLALVFDGRDLAAGVWLCASVLFCILSEVEAQR